jgi:hypothetical protein
MQIALLKGGRIPNFLIKNSGCVKNLSYSVKKGLYQARAGFKKSAGHFAVLE